MFNTRLIVSVFEFALAVLMSGFVISLTYRVFIKANPDFDMEAEIKKGNAAVGQIAQGGAGPTESKAPTARGRISRARRGRQDKSTERGA